MSAVDDEEDGPTLKHFDELFNAVSSNSIAGLHALILRLKSSSALQPDFVYNLLNKAHPIKMFTILQWAIGIYPKTSLWVIRELLVYGAGTELPINHLTTNEESPVTPLWMAIEKKHPVELVKLLLSFKSDPFFQCPFREDEKCGEIKENDGYSLLHIAVKVETDEEILNELIEASSGILLNDQNNSLKETPLMLAIEQKNLKISKFLIENDKTDFYLRNSNDLNAYELAAKNNLVDICKLFHNYPDFINECFYYLEIIQKIKINNMQVWRNLRDLRDFRDLGESDELLPIEGYWEWIDSDWLVISEEGLMCRLRRMIMIKEPIYLKEAIESIKTSPKTSLNLLLRGLQQEKDPMNKSKAANYFQRLLKWVDEGERRLNGNNVNDSSVSIGLLDNLSRSDLRVFSEDDSGNKPGIGIKKVKSDLITIESGDSDDSLLYCPVCSHRFLQDRESHLTTCLTRKSIIGRRYTSTKINDNNMVKGECPICYEDLGKGRVAVMDCLCKFHVKCIEEWLRRGKQCPFHGE